MSPSEYDLLTEQLRAATAVVNAFKSEQVQLRVVDALISALTGKQVIPEAEPPKPEGGAAETP
jgi:hypothetical protein